MVGCSSASASATLEWIACVGVIPLALHAEMTAVVWDVMRRISVRGDFPGVEEWVENGRESIVTLGMEPMMVLRVRVAASFEL